MTPIELNPDGTFPQKYSKPIVFTSTTATTSVKIYPDFKPSPPKKKIWEDYKKDLINLYLVSAILIGTVAILIAIVESVIKLIKIVF